MSNRRTLALFALAALVFVGLPTNRALADTLHVNVSQSPGTPTGYVSVWSGYNPRVIDSAHVTSFDDITRGYYERDGRYYPWQNGFCSFSVPHFTAQMTPACTLFYYQSAHNGTSSLIVDWLYDIRYVPYIYDDIFWAVWDDRDSVVATDSVRPNGWHHVALAPWACNELVALAAPPVGGLFLTGWLYSGFVDGTYADVVSTGDNATYIKVTYTP